MSIFNIPQSLLEAINTVILKEHEMTKREVAFVDNNYENEISNHREATKKISGHIFPEDQDRIVIPLETQEHPVKTAVESHLHSNGFHSTDYRAGLTKDKYNRDVSIGKALTRTGADKSLIDKFAIHQKTIAQQPDTTSHLQVVISKHPHDVIGMSQGTDWGLRPGENPKGDTKPTQSCMRFGTEQHNVYMPFELNAGTHVAWLTHIGDNEAKEPLARITLRPFEKSNSDDVITKYRMTIPKRRVDWILDIHQDLIDSGVKMPTKLNEGDPVSKKIEDVLRHEHQTILNTEHNEIEPHLREKVKDIKYSHESDRYHHLYLDIPTGMSSKEALDYMRTLRSYSIPASGLEEDFDNPHETKSTNSEDAPNTILIPSNKIYGKQVDAFKSTVKNWSKKLFNAPSGVLYKASKDIYMDGDPRQVTM